MNLVQTDKTSWKGSDLQMLKQWNNRNDLMDFKFKIEIEW